jgi:hypothetical protein
MNEKRTADNLEDAKFETSFAEVLVQRYHHSIRAPRFYARFELEQPF